MPSLFGVKHSIFWFRTQLFSEWIMLDYIIFVWMDFIQNSKYLLYAPLATHSKKKTLIQRQINVGPQSATLAHNKPTLCEHLSSIEVRLISFSWSQKAISTYLTSKQILPYGSADQCITFITYDTSEENRIRVLVAIQVWLSPKKSPGSPLSVSTESPSQKPEAGNWFSSSQQPTRACDAQTRVPPPLSQYW